MVKYKKRRKVGGKKSYLTKSTATALKMRGGFSPRLPRGAAMKSMAGKIVREGMKGAGTALKGEALRRVSTALKDVSIPEDFAPFKDVLVGKLQNAVARDTTGGSAGSEVPYIQSESEAKKLGVGNPNFSAKVYRTKFQFGRPLTRAMKQLGKLNGTTKYTLFDSQFNLLTPATGAGRASLNMEAGFNQKLVYTSQKMNITIDDLMDIGRLKEHIAADYQYLRSYASFMSKTWRYTFINQGSYFPANVKLHMLRPKNAYSAYAYITSTSLPSTTEFDGSQRVKDILPQYAWMSGRNSALGVNSRFGLIDPKATLNMSPRWREEFETVKSMSKRLNPGDTWNFTAKEFLGPGINLESAKVIDEFPDSPDSYLFYVEVVGVPCEGVPANSPDNTVIGTSPAFVTMEVKTETEFVNQSFGGDSSIEFPTSGTHNQFSSANPLIRTYFKREAEDSSSFLRRRINYNVAQIKDKATALPTDMYIPVLTDAVVRYAGEASDKN